ncbi:glycine betaine/proline transport system substrate-binding protein [Mumia flava]|uniref:Glycine betaine/proline transport system substrate-binding protein n=1 Tax=Mumia flava TaxID=1348852 RepID=A0A0B2BL73_9ACTN|nr:glycine betaine ABC transporter substrate-binding protein [Mumia flava]PJJ56391.1 glycine betaine/proline transport system substrate-binding protein [Mumia flava]
MRKTLTARASAVAATLLSVALLASACGSDDGDSDGGSSGDGGGTINLGIIPSWTDGLSTAYLWKNVLEGEGYTVEITELSEAAPLYAGLANGDVDVYPSAWPDVTHASYMEQYGDDLEDVGTYYDNAKLTVAVPEYSELNSLEDLKGKGDQYDNTIVGIEKGAGLTKVVQESVIPEYGLGDEYELQTSSTTGMLTELQKATDNNEDIIVTLWRPYWANTAFPVKDLEDPMGALGEPEGLHEVATAGFSDEFPEVAEMMANMKLDDEQYGSLEDTVVNQFEEGQEEEAIDAWLEENPDFIDSLQG